MTDNHVVGGSNPSLRTIYRTFNYICIINNFYMGKGLKNKILNLREKGWSYSKIKNKLKCSSSTISYHCKNHNLSYIGLMDTRKLSDEKILKVQEYYKTHTLKQTAEKFNVSVSGIKRYLKLIVKKVILSTQERKKRNYLRVKTARQKIKEKAVKYKGGKCEKCGYDKCIWAFDFHHIEPKQKDFNISRYSTTCWEKIKKELDKCIIVCSNCHRELHYEMKQCGIEQG